MSEPYGPSGNSPEQPPPAAPFGSGPVPPAPPGPPSYGPPPGPPSYGPPSGGYAGGPPPAGGAPIGYSSSDDKNWALIAHFGGAAGVLLLAWGGFIAPLIVMLSKGQSPTVRAHAVKALNFQLTWLGVSVVISLVSCCIALVTFGLGFFLLIVPWVVGIVFGVIAGIKANDGQLYEYPMTITMVK